MFRTNATLLHPLALAISMACAAAPTAAIANTVIITNCSDDGIGSLRAAAISAHSGDTVDLTQLACSSISLQTGEIAINQDDLTIQGPGRQFIVGGKYKGRVFHHFGSGTLTLRNITIEDGAFYHYVNQQNSPYTAAGGCIASNKSVSLDNVRVSNCKVIDAHNSGLGFEPASAGGAIAAYQVTLNASVVEASSATSKAGNNLSGQAHGGGIYTGFGGLAMTNSTVRGNQAMGGGFVSGGGVDSRGLATIIASTLSGNSTNGSGGGAYFSSTLSASVENSTVSGNSAARAGGLFVNAIDVQLSNTTVAFNSAATAGATGAGVFVTAYHGSTSADLQSTIIAANNYGAGTANDFEALRSVTISGSHNLIGTSSSGLPADTIIGVCPLLGPLRDNGGPTWTHALLGHSPAIDTGNNPAAFSTDQRGAGHARTIGAPGASSPHTDIGAYEVDRMDNIFDASFEGCS